MTAKKRTLGKSGIEVSEISFGGVEIGMPYGIGVKRKEDMLSETDAIKLLREAVGEGINFFDTARLYGESEKIMGKAFAGVRSEVVICTKCKHFLDGNGNVPSKKELKRIIETSLDESLAMLQTDYVDVFMLHQANTEILNDENIPAVFLSLKEKGKIRLSGVSTYSTDETELALDGGHWDAIQLPFNLMDQRQKRFFSIAEEKGTAIVIRSVLLKGLLSDRGKNLHPALSEVEKHIRSYDKLLEDVSYSLATLATKFVLSHPEVSAALVGIDSFSYLEQALEAANGDYLDQKKLVLAGESAFPDPEFINLPYWDEMNWLK